MENETPDRESKSMSPERQAFLDMMIGKIRDELPEIDLRPRGFGFIFSDEKKGQLRIKLEIPFLKTQLLPEDPDQIVEDWLSGFREVAAGEYADGGFDTVRKDLFLAVRPIQVYKQMTSSDGAAALAFCWPVTPDLAIYWATDRAGGIGYVTRSLFESWNMGEEEVTKVAYENTVRAEANMSVDTVQEGGILISSTSRFATIAHLLYWPGNLKELILRHVPEHSNGRFLVSVALPFRMMVARWGNYRGIRRFQEDQVGTHGRLMSREVYVLHDGDLIDRVSSVVGEGRCLICRSLEDWGLVPERINELPYRPGRPHEASSQG